MQGSFWLPVVLFVMSASCHSRSDRSTHEPMSRPATDAGSAWAPTPAGGKQSTPIASSNTTATDLIRQAREQVPLAENDSTCLPATQRLARKDPELLLAVARSRADDLGTFARPCLNDQRVADALRGRAASHVLVTMLQTPATWRFEAQVPWARAARWLLEHSERIFDQADPKMLEPLLAAPHLAEDALRSGLLVALMRLEPQSARGLLVEWAPRLQRPDARFVTLFMREHSVSHAPRAWLDEAEEPCEERRARAVFTGVRRTDPEARRTLLAYLDAADTRWAERPLAVHFFIDALIELGAPVSEFVCREELSNPCGMMSVQRADRIEKARRACLSGARSWLRVNSERAGHGGTATPAQL